MDWRIFFIGPMRAGDATAEAASEPGRRQLRQESGRRLAKMVEAVVAELKGAGYLPAGEGEHRLTGGTAVDSVILTREADGDRVTLIQPEELFGPDSVPSNVFDAIDDADLVVADLSEQRPAVIYELALAHALGIWTILLSSGPEDSLMFYLRGYRHAIVDFDADDIRSQEFATAFAAWLSQRNKRFDSGNPFTDFYGAPIPDISAASGLALSYYENFLRRVLSPGARIVDQSVAQRPVRKDVAGVLVVKPASLRELGGDIIERLADVLGDAFGDQVKRGEEGKVFIDTAGFGDRTCEFVVDGWLVDVPRSVLTLERSPRLLRATRTDDRQRARDHLAHVLIARFLEVTRTALEGDRDIKRRRERFYYGSIEEVVRFLALRPEERPSVWQSPDDKGRPVTAE